MSGKMRFFYSFGVDTMHNKEASTPAKTFQGLIIAKSRAKIWPVKYVHVLFLPWSRLLFFVMPRSHIHGFDLGLATDAILHHPWQSVLVCIFPYFIRNHT